MRRPSVHVATVDLAEEADPRALGGCVTLALCGAWDHAPPCPLAPHHTEVVGDDGRVQVRVVLAAEPEDEEEAHRLVATALARGTLATPAGTTSRWTLVGSGRGELTDAERDLGARLCADG